MEGWVRVGLAALRPAESVAGGAEKMLADLDRTQATRFYAKRYHPEWYPA